MTESSEDVTQTIRSLLADIGEITVEEFRAQDVRFDPDSRSGRELLFLLANNEWIRGTTETVTTGRADAVDTSIQIDVDLDLVRHEAFRYSDRMTLPLVLLPPPRQPASAGDRRKRSRPALIRAWFPGPAPRVSLSYDALSSLAVTDGSGYQLPAVPSSELHHRVSAALAEIILTMATARTDHQLPQTESSRDQRLVLSAAIFRMLRGQGGGRRATQAAHSPHAPAPRTVAEDDHVGDDSPATVEGATYGRPAARDQEPGNTGTTGGKNSSGPTSGRLYTARADLTTTLTGYADAYQRAVPRGQHRDRPTADVLTERAVRVLRAFTGALLVAVEVPRTRTASVFTVKVPTRRLRIGRARVLRRPRARLEVDLLLPSSHASRQIQVVLPVGLTTEIPHHGRPSAKARIKVGRPAPFDQLSVLMTDLLADSRSWPVRRCIADLAVTRVDAGREALRHYDSRGKDADEVQVHSQEHRLDRLRVALEQHVTDDDAWLLRIRAAWDDGSWLPAKLSRRTSVDAVSPQTVTGRAEAIEDPAQRASPTHARLRLDVTVTDANLFDYARYSGSMSIVLLSVVLAFVLLSRGNFNAEVLAGALTLFSAVQAGRVEHPDRSTLRGLLGAAGYWVIVLSVLPTVVLAIALAFLGETTTDHRVWLFAAGSISAQVVLQLVMTRGPLSDVGVPGRSPGLQLITDPHPNYARVDVLHSGWWRSTTAEALLLGREAHAYVVRQHGQSLSELLTDEQTVFSRFKAIYRPGGERENALRNQNILALLRAGTIRQSLTFVVFREEAGANWVRDSKAARVELDPDRLAPNEAPAEVMEIFVGTPTERPPDLNEHPLRAVLNNCRDKELPLLDVQLPVPAPLGQRSDLRWLQVRLGVQDAHLGAVADFLEELHTSATADSNDWAVLVQVVPEMGSRRFGHDATTDAPPRVLRSTDLDVVGVASGTADRDWRVVALCANARLGIEADVLDAINEQEPGFHLAGLTAAVLHGKAVLFVLGRRSSGTDAVQLERVAQIFDADQMTVVVDDWETALDLSGSRTDERLAMLRVHLRFPDRPGMLAGAISELHRVLKDADGRNARPVTDFDPWFVLLQVAEGQSARTAMTIRIPERLVADLNGNTGRSERLGRSVRRALTVHSTAGSVGGPGSDETVVAAAVLWTGRRKGW